LNPNLHFLDFELAAPVTRVATPSFYMQVIPRPQTMPGPFGRANKFPRKDKWGMMLYFKFCIGEKGWSKIGIWKEVLPQSLH
jgi:hypothetical protein